MAEDPIEKQLQFFFPKATRSDWKRIAVQETDGNDPFETLSWNGSDDIRFLPYYDAQDTAGLSLAIPENARHKQPWLNIPAINVLDDERAANQVAREHIKRGANGVLFYLDQLNDSTIGALTREIDLSDHQFFFRLKGDQQFPETFPVLDANGAPSKVNGALFWESIPKTSKLSECFKRSRIFRALGIVVAPRTPAQEIAEALQMGIQAYERFSELEDPTDVLHAIAFSVAADVSFLETAAKLIALRSLWLQVAHAYGHDDYNTADLHVHARCLAIPHAADPPHQNMLKATFTSMAATAAGCDSLTIEGSEESPLFQRWGINVSNILREESFFGRTSNPLAGAYAVEGMSDAIAKRAWEIFQQKMKTL